MDNALKEIKVVSEGSYKIGYQKALDDVKAMIKEKAEEIGNEIIKEHERGLKHSKYNTLIDLLQDIDEM